jgi:soluble lytic murein transglycosylase
MVKKLLYFVVLISIISSNLITANSEDLKILPLKKPNLTDEEIEKKLSINILKPLEKPKEKSEPEIEEIKIEPSETKITFIIPKKKPIIIGKTSSERIEISKYYNKKDFNIAKKQFLKWKKANGQKH